MAHFLRLPLERIDPLDLAIGKLKITNEVFVNAKIAGHP
jgi:hypothetical protein